MPMNLEIINDPQSVINLKHQSHLWISPDGIVYPVYTEGHQSWIDEFIENPTTDNLYPCDLEVAGWIHISYGSIINTTRLTRQQRDTLTEWFLVNHRIMYISDDSYQKAHRMGIRVEEPSATQV